MRKSIYLLILCSIGSIQAYTGERCTVACILGTVRVNNLLDREILGKVCSIQDLLTAGCSVTPITSQPFTITEPGAYCLASSLQATGPGAPAMITIQSDSVSIDLNSQTLDANGADIAIDLTGQDRVEIKGGSIINAAVQGLLISNADQVMVEGVKFEGNATALTIEDESCEVVVDNCQFTQSSDNVISAENSDKITIKNCTMCENTGPRGISCVECGSTIIDTVAIVNHTTTALFSGIRFQDLVLPPEGTVQINNVAIKNCSGDAGVIGIILLGIPSATITDCSIINLGSQSGGVVGIGNSGGIIRDCLVSNLFSFAPGASITGLDVVGLVENCVLSLLNTSTVSHPIICYSDGGNSFFINNLAEDCTNSVNEPASTLNGFRVGLASVFTGNVALDLMRTNTTLNSGGFNIPSFPTNARLTGNTATGNTIAGFLIDNSDPSETNSFFENQSGNNIIAGGVANYRLLGGASPVVRVFDVSLGMFTSTPEPFDNISIVS